MLLYHFTSQVHLINILTENRLRLTESNVKPNGDGPRVVWLTDNPRPRQGWQRGSAVYKGRIRITVEVDDAQKWTEWAKRRGSPPFWMAALIEAAKGDDDPAPGDHWYVVTHTIPYRQWRKIEDTRTNQTLWEQGNGTAGRVQAGSLRG
jgi:hypothetical protein